MSLGIGGTPGERVGGTPHDRTRGTPGDLLRRPLASVDGLLNQLAGWRYNPLYQSGSIAVVSLGVVLVTGLYLLLFYRIGAPYESMQRIDAQLAAGRWIRGMHRYASDLAVAAVAVHALRMLLQGRCWGPRALAWLSGLVLLGLVFVCGWTGYVMVWDTQAQLFAVEGARLLDALPLFSQPIARTFSGERPLPGAFFFLNLFAHIALPIGLALLLWLHLSRVARPVLLPPRPLLWAMLLALFAASLLAPPALNPRADLFYVPGRVEIDLFYGFWLPGVRRLSPTRVWLVLGVGLAIAGLVPWWARPRRSARLARSRGEESLCTGCLQCALDCPYDAIDMIPGARGHAVARVDPARCVACGICAASCAPMAIGPPGRTGRDQLAAARAFVESGGCDRGVVAIACRNGAGGLAAAAAPGALADAGAEDGAADGAPVLAVSCAGNLHTSVIELLLRSGAAGVLVATCPPRDCWSREGPRWLGERAFHGREAELHDRVDRRRLRLVHAGAGERGRVRRALRSLRDEVAALERPAARREVEIDTACEGTEPARPGDAP